MKELISTMMLAFGFIVMLTLLMAVPTWLLWNWLMPDIFGVKEIGILQAWGLNFLCGILFKDTTKK